ncbi:MAG: polysaccharide biosynthesis tyrosine autokinase [bacterium]
MTEVADPPKVDARQKEGTPRGPVDNKTYKNGETGTSGTSIKYRQTKTVHVSEATLREHRLMAFFDDTPVSDQYKLLKTNILQKTMQEGLNTLLVTSSVESEGKSITAANLAISLAKELQQTVLLVDADLRRPSLHALFGLHPSSGLSDYLIHQTPLTDLLISPGINKLTILLGHKRIINSTEVIGSSRMRDLVQEVKHRYQDRYIIFDSPPLLACADSLVLSEYVDGIIFVVEYGKTQQYQLEKALRLIQGKNLIGTVLNKYPPLKEHSYYY